MPGAGLADSLFPGCARDPPRRYRTIVACGVFGLGSTRAQDEEALRRFHRSLEPGGTLALDIEVPWANMRHWSQWTRAERERLPEPWPESGERKRADDGCECELRTRTLEIDPLAQTLVLEIRAEKFRDGRLLAAEEYALSLREYFPTELLHLLERSGFTGVEVLGDHNALQRQRRQRRLSDPSRHPVPTPGYPLIPDGRLSTSATARAWY